MPRRPRRRPPRRPAHDGARGPVSPHDRETLRQQMLLRALLGDARPACVGGWLRAPGPAGGPDPARGLAAYRANAGALAERALAAAYPTLQQLLGADSLAGLARHFWHRHPPQAGDIARGGADLADFIAAAPALADEPYLADLARLEWAVHCAATAADAGPPLGLGACRAMTRCKNARGPCPPPDQP
ncbi:MAG: hypothetical protein C0505_00690 [Leptothrix sp. (in: Bacteria)]|nr:hypothetical protein [Leptothrix sp. (in: b-proteobacteria)]